MNADQDRDDSISSPPSDELLERYVAGRCTPAERHLVDRWLARDPVRLAWMRALQRGLTDAPRFDAESMLSRVRSRIARAGPHVRPARRAPLILTWRSSRLPLVFATAAVVVLGFGAVLLERFAHDDRPPVVSPMREIATRRGQQAALDLADGSRVILAAESKLRIPADYDAAGTNGVRRDLYLEGKAYFQVQHDTSRPFLVHTATAVTEDIGTEFVVSAYRDAHATQVAVVSGAVALRRSLDAPSSARGGGRVPVLERSAPLMVLVPGDVARLDTTGTVTLARNVRITPYVSWTDGVLAFDGAPLRSALAELSRWYDVDFELVGHALDSTRITAEFRNESLDRATQHLALMLGVRVTHRGRSVLLSPSAHRSRDRVRAR